MGVKRIQYLIEKRARSERRREERRQRKEYDVANNQQQLAETTFVNNAKGMYPGVPGVPNYSRPTDPLMQGAANPNC